MPSATLDDCLKKGRSVIDCMSSPSETVSPSGKSIFESVVTGEKDPTVPEFQKARENVGQGFMNIGKAFSFLGDRRIWIVIAALIGLVAFAVIVQKLG